MQMSLLASKLQSACSRAGAFITDRRATSAIEFAILAPLMITLYFGGIEITEALSANRKTTLVARTVADLVAQKSSIIDADKNNILDASAAVATPYSDANLRVVISSIKIDNTGNAKVAWSDTLHGVARSPGQTVTLDAALAVPNTSLILGEVTYVYKPLFGDAIIGPFEMSDRIYMRPRISACVTRPPSVTTC